MSKWKDLLRQGLSCFAIGLCLLQGVTSSRAFSDESGSRSAREWRQVPIEGAVCGDGAAYSVYVSAGDPKMVAFDIMGGGACWSAKSCFAAPIVWVHPVPGVFEKSGFLSTDPLRSPVSNHTMVYFPYCTGDVHLGAHVASYASLTTVHHVGALNFEKAVAQLVARGDVTLAGAEQFVMMGYSAGAIGALFHVLNMDFYLKGVKDKVLIADSPGLHFGQKFWDKFPQAWIDDISAAMGRAGLHFARGNGNLAEVIPAVCKRLPDWRIAVLQGSRDIVMSKVFGEETQDEHEASVFGPNGLYALTADPKDNCSAWVPTTEMHTFMLFDATANMKTEDGKTAMDFVRDTVMGVGGRNYR